MTILSFITGAIIGTLVAILWLCLVFSVTLTLMRLIEEIFHIKADRRQRKHKLASGKLVDHALGRMTADESNTWYKWRKRK